MTDNIIITPRLNLKHIFAEPTPSELEQMVKWLNDPMVVQYSEQRHRNHTFRSQRDYCNSFLLPSQLRIIYWIEDPIGTITAHIDTNNNIADMGIMIGDTQVWGEGFGTEAWQAMMSYLFNHIGIRKIEAGCMDLNRAMVGIFKNSGMKKEGIRKDHFINSRSEGGYTMCDLEQWGKFKDG